MQLATEPLTEASWTDAVGRFLDLRLEAGSFERGPLVAGIQAHPLVDTLHLAFVDHRPVVLSPDAIWLTLVQGVATHIAENADALRDRLVTHSGRETLVLVRDEFVRGSTDNDWPSVFGDFAAFVEQEVGPLAPSMTAPFSTTDPVARIASQVSLLGAVQSYYDFVVVTRCGIPQLRLTGTVDDWRDLRARIERFSELDLAWWLSGLRPTLDAFVQAAESGDTRALARDLYKWKGAHGSGSPAVSGRVVTLFPYLMNEMAAWRADAPIFVRNEWIDTLPHGRNAPHRGNFPRNPAMVPFVWRYLGQELPMWFVGGLIGIRQHADLALEPAIGWAVAPNT